MNLLFNHHLVWNLFQGTPLGNTGGGNDDSWVYVMEIEKNRMRATDRVTQIVGGGAEAANSKNNPNNNKKIKTANKPQRKVKMDSSLFLMI